MERNGILPNRRLHTLPLETLGLKSRYIAGFGADIRFLLECDSGRKCVLETSGPFFRAKDRCSCGGRLRPDVVWFGESLPPLILDEAFEAAANCDLFFSIGTSQQVYPAARLPLVAREQGAYVIEINPEPTPLSGTADLSLREKAGNALPELFEEFHVAFS